MKKTLTISAFLVLFICLLAFPAMAVEGEATNPATQNQKLKFGPDNNNRKNDVVMETKGQKLHKAYFNNIEDRKKKRDEGLKLREKNIKNNDPGNMGL